MSTKRPERSDGSTLQGLSRALNVLRALEKRSGWTLADLHQATLLSKPTLLRILHTLAEEGFVRRRAADGTWWLAWRPGPGRLARQKELIAEAGRGELDALTSLAGWPADLSLYNHGMMELVETTRDGVPLEQVPLGHRVPMLASAVGRCWLGHCPDEERVAIIEMLRRSTSPYDRLAHKPEVVADIVAATRRQGYAFRIRGYQGVLGPYGGRRTAMAVPIFARRRVHACLNIVWDARFVAEADFVAAHLPAMQQAAARIGERLDRLIAEEDG